MATEYEEAKARMKKDWHIYNEAMPDNSALAFIQAADKEIATKDAELAACKKLCEIYFNIAAEEIGEDRVRGLRDEALKSNDS